MTGDGNDDTSPQPTGVEETPTPPRKRRRRRRRRGSRAPAPPAGQQVDPSAGGERTPAAATEGGGGKGRGISKSKGRGQPRGSKTRKGSPPAGSKLPWAREVSAGGVVYRRTPEGEIEVVLASRRTRRGDLAWGLAKGGIEDGESQRQAAIREVREETGLTAVIEADLGDTKYMYVWEDVRIRKTVHFFLMRCTGGDVEDRDDEMEEIRWFPLARALKRAAYRGERDMLARAAELLS
jgi:8-oxo-dGTP pyrophosphatase MutT (NUDIX family)